MFPRPLANWLVGLLGAAMVLFGLAAPAHAVAPMCDDRAASAIAPTPIDPLPDLSWEPGMPWPCIPVFMPLGFALLQPGDASPTVKPTAALDALTIVRPSALPKPGSASGLAADESLPPSKGFAMGVFRPPRTSLP
jgi:hypothetical protein